MKRVIGNKMVGGQSSFLPLKVNSAGVIPIIFAVSIQYFPMTVANIFTHGEKEHWFTKFAQGLVPGTAWHFGGAAARSGVRHICGDDHLLHLLLYGGNGQREGPLRQPEEVGELHPGYQARQADAGLPGSHHDQDHSRWRDIPFDCRPAGVLRSAAYRHQTLSLVGGTSLPIVVGVALETMQAIDSHLLMRHYQGFRYK